MSAIVYGTAKVWTAAAERRSGWVAKEQAEQNLRSFTARMLKRLHPLLPAVGVRLTANVLWSSAKLGLNPDALVPGMTDSLAQQFVADMNAANGQDFAAVLVACAQLQLSPCQGALFKAICGRLAVADLSNFNSQNVSNILHSLATLPAAAPSVEMLDALCQRFGVLLNGHQATNGPNELPNSQNIANTIWALSKLKYAPADELAMSMVGRITALCCLGQQPIPQDISTVLLACAELRLPVTQTESEDLASVLLNFKCQLGMRQMYSNTVWSLAVLGHLRQAQFALALDHLIALSVSHGGLSQPSVVTNIEMRQLTRLWTGCSLIQLHLPNSNQHGPACKGSCTGQDPDLCRPMPAVMTEVSSAQLWISCSFPSRPWFPYKATWLTLCWSRKAAMLRQSS